MSDITVQELKERQANNESLNVIDVREQWEHEEDNFGGQLLPLGEIPTRLAEVEHLRNEEVIVHCKTGGRSGRAQKYLQSQGFTNVRNLLGGIEAYRES